MAVDVYLRQAELDWDEAKSNTADERRKCAEISDKMKYHTDTQLQKLRPKFTSDERTKAHIRIQPAFQKLLKQYRKAVKKRDKVKDIERSKRREYYKQLSEYSIQRDIEKTQKYTPDTNTPTKYQKINMETGEIIE